MSSPTPKIRCPTGRGDGRTGRRKRKCPRRRPCMNNQTSGQTSHRPVSLVTGAGRGIGRGVAVELAKLGHAVVVNYAGNANAAEECLRLVREAGGDGITARADVSVSADRERLVQETLEAYGRIDLLVNNAGVAPSLRADLLEASEESFDRLINVNLKGPYFLTQTVARRMIEQVR